MRGILTRIATMGRDFNTDCHNEGGGLTRITTMREWDFSTDCHKGVWDFNTDYHNVWLLSFLLNVV